MESKILIGGVGLHHIGGYVVRELEYPFDPRVVLRKRRSLRRTLLEECAFGSWVDTRIAILGGSTTRDLRDCLELFLLDQGIRSEFWESDFDQWFEDGAFPNHSLEVFQPDVIWICTGARNIRSFPVPSDDVDEVARKLDEETARLEAVWEHVAERYHCVILQNTFEYLGWRLLGNADVWMPQGRVNFVTRLNLRIADWAQRHDSFQVVDANWLASWVGLESWEDPASWYLYKEQPAPAVAPLLSFEAAKVVKSLFGKNRKVLDVDLDNTLWHGIVGEDGADAIEVGQETPIGQSYAAFQDYLKRQKEIGVLLAVNSKNDREKALAGLARPDAPLGEKDFVSIKANWDPKSQNLEQTADELRLLPGSFVFVDDNPFERSLVSAQLPEVAVPELDESEGYVRVLDRSGFFEVTSLSADDLSRNQMYAADADRSRQRKRFSHYEDYLTSLQMVATIEPFNPAFYQRISQLTNKSNQFNLTTLRLTVADVKRLAEDSRTLTLAGRLKDAFGDLGVVSLIVGTLSKDDPTRLDLDLWLMSCRVLKRGMEQAMADALEQEALRRGVRLIRGRYRPTAKNAMVAELFGELGFRRVGEEEGGVTVWELEPNRGRKPRQRAIEVAKTEGGAR